MEMSSEKQQLPKPKRRWFQLRLRTLLVLVTLASVPLSWVGWELEQRQREKVAIAWVEEMRGQVSFGSVEIDGFLSSDLETSWWKKTKDTLFGESVHYFNLGNTKVSDLSPLADMKKLVRLYLDQTEVSDLSPLAGMKYLRGLSLEGTEVSEEQIEQLQLALPKCKISR
jgi:Leucine-rich repeat (LRR) protein